MALQILLLGKGEVRRDDSPPAVFRGKSSLYLLATLVLHANRPVERTWLAEMLWPESDPERGLYNLRRALHDLRQALGEDASRLSAPRSSLLQLQLDAGESDVLSLLAAETRADDDAVVAAYTGPLLPECSLLWFEGKRAELAHTYERALERLARRSPPEEAIFLWQRRLHDDPLHEGAVRELMTSLAATRQPLEVRRVYRQFRLRLHDSLLGEPSPETRALFETLQAPSAALPSDPEPAPLIGLPLVHPLTACFGREGELDRLQKLIGEEGARLVSIIGLGGVGKTRLALELAARLDRPMAFLPLTEVAPGDSLPTFFCSRLFSDLQTDDDDVEAHLIKRLHALGPLLLILDNLEHLVGPKSRAFFERLLQRLPECQILFTSRQPLRIPGERLLPLEPFAIPDRLPQDPHLLREFPCIQLLESRARGFHPYFEISSQNSEAILTLCGYSEGIALALELIASHLRLLSPELLTKHLSHLKSTRECLEKIFESTVALLPESEQSALRRLHFFRGGFTLEAAQAVLAESDVGRVLQILETLHDLSFLTVRGERFYLLEPLRDFAQQTSTAEEKAETIQRHACYFREFTRAQETLFLSQRPLAHRIFDAEQDNIFLAFAHSTTSEKIELAISFSLHAFARPALVGFLEQMLALPAESDLQRARLCDRFGALYGNLGHWEKAEPMLREALALYSPVDQRVAHAHILGNLGAFYADARRWEEAEEVLLRAIDEFEILELSRHRAIALTNLGVVTLRIGDPQKSEQLFLESLRIREVHEDLRGIAITLSNLGAAALALGDSSKSERLYQKALETLLPLKDPVILSSTLDGLACMKAHTGDFPEAARLFGQAEGWRSHAKLSDPPSWHDTIAPYQKRTLDALNASSWKCLFEEGRQRSVI